MVPWFLFRLGLLFQMKIEDCVVAWRSASSAFVGVSSTRRASALDSFETKSGIQNFAGREQTRPGGRDRDPGPRTREITPKYYVRPTKKFVTIVKLFALTLYNLLLILKITKESQKPVIKKAESLARPPVFGTSLYETMRLKSGIPKNII